MINRRYGYVVLLLFLLFFCFFINIFQKNVFYVIQKNKLFHRDTINISKPWFNKEKSQLINVSTDVLSLDINLLGGNIERAELLNYKKDFNKQGVFTLLNNKKNFFYKMNSGILKKDTSNTIEKMHPILYDVSSVLYQLKKNKNKINVCLTSKLKDGIIYKKVFFLKRGSYKIDIRNYIYNNTNHTINAVVFGELQKNTSLIKKYSFLKSFFNLQTFRGISYSADDKKYVKVSFDDLKDSSNFYLKINQGWIAMQQQYFLTAWIPKFSHGYTIYLYKLYDYLTSVGFFSKNQKIMPYSSSFFSSSIWIGPNLQKPVSLLAKNTNCIMDYGWLFFISRPLFQLLSFFYSFCNNWGLAIIFITCFIKIMTYSLIKSQYLAMMKIRNLQSKVELIKEKFFNDTQKINKEILRLYKSENINPFSSFFPNLIQMPIFLALYYVLTSAIELRHAPFFLWIQDLSDFDPFFILPLLTGVSFLGIQISNENNPRPLSYNKIFFIFPILSAVFFLWFPSGLVLYYLINNVVTIIQQYFIKKIFMQNKKDIL